MQQFDSFCYHSTQISQDLSTIRFKGKGANTYCLVKLCSIEMVCTYGTGWDNWPTQSVPKIDIFWWEEKLPNRCLRFHFLFLTNNTELFSRRGRDNLIQMAALPHSACQKCHIWNRQLKDLYKYLIILEKRPEKTL